MINSSLSLKSTSSSHLKKIVVLLLLFIPPLMVGVLAYFGQNIFLALVGAVALAIGVLMFVKPETTTIVVLFVLYANLTVVAINSYGIPELIAASFFLLLGLPFLNYVIFRHQPIVTTRVFFLMLLYLGVLFISAAFSRSAAESVDRILGFIIEGIVLYFLIINAIRTPQLVRWGVWAIICAGILMGSVSLYQELTGDYDNDFGGLARVKEAEVSTGEFDEFGKKIKRRRLAGTIGSKNRYAQVMVVLLPFALMRIWAERSWLLRIIAALACIPIIAGALLTFSRGAGLSIIAIILAMVLLRMIKPWHFILIATIGYLFVVTILPEYIYRISTVVDLGAIAAGETEGASGSIVSRSNVNLATFNIFVDNPLVGVGPGQTNLYTSEYGNEIGTYYRSIDNTRRAHNMYLEELADTGIIGFSLFMGIVFFTMYQTWQIRKYWMDRNRPDIAYTAAGFFLGILAYLATAMFLHLSYVRYYWFLLAFSAAFIRIYGTQEQLDAAINGSIVQPPIKTASIARKPFAKKPAPQALSENF